MSIGEYRGIPDAKLLLRYVRARYDRSLIERSYRAYVTDSLSLIPRMSYLTSRWVDLVYGDAIVADDRSAEDIIEDVASRLEGE